MRKLKFTSKESIVLFQALNMAKNPQQGFTQAEAKKTRPIREALLGFNNSKEESMISFPEGTELIVKEDEFEIVKNYLKNSYGWKTPQDCDFVSDFIEKLRDVPVLSEEINGDEKKQKNQ